MPISIYVRNAAHILPLEPTVTRPYRILPNPNAPQFAPLLGWRAWLGKLGLPVRRTRICFISPPSTITVHPDNLPWLRQVMAKRGLRYIMGAPALREVEQ